MSADATMRRMCHAHGDGVVMLRWMLSLVEVRLYRLYVTAASTSAAATLLLEHRARVFYQTTNFVTLVQVVA
jgi:hypothetical protein